MGVLRIVSDFEQFERSLGRREWEDGCDLDALGRLVGGERQRAEATLIERLRSGSDSRVAIALAWLATPAAKAALRVALTSANGGVQAAAAGVMLGDDPEAAGRAALRAITSTDDSARAAAVRVLARLPGEEVHAALLAAAGDPTQSVRWWAVESLFERLGLGRLVAPRRGLTLLSMRLASSFETLWRPAHEELVGLLDALRAGRSPAELGLRVEPPIDDDALQAWTRSLRSCTDEEPYRKDFDLAALDALGAEDRAWAELGLIGLLERRDPRAPRALLHLGSRLAVEPLASMLPGALASPTPTEWRRFVVEVAQALWQLTGPSEARAMLQTLARDPDPEIRDRARAGLAG